MQSEAPRHLRLSVRILLVLGTVIAAIIFVAAVIAYNSVNNLTRQAGTEWITEDVLVIQGRMAVAGDQLIDDTQYLAQYLAASEAMLTGDLITIQTNLILNESAYLSGTDQIVVVDSARRPIVYLAHGKVMPAEESELTELLSYALLGISVSGVLEQDALVLAAAVPIQTNLGEIVGAVQIGKNLDAEFLRSINFARSGVHLVLMNKQGEVTASYFEANYQIQNKVRDVLEDPYPQSYSSSENQLVRYDKLLEHSLFEQALNGDVVYQSEFVYSAKDRPLIAAYIPFLINYDPEGVLVILVDLNTLTMFRDDLISKQISALVLIGVASAIGLALLAWRMIVFPIEQLQHATIRLAGGDYSHRAKVYSRDEIGRLATTFNQMADSLLERDGEIAAEIAERKRAEQALRSSRDELEQRVAERTHELQVAVDQLHVELERRNQAEQQIRTALQEKEVLLKEIHHRVKNNMQVMSSLLRLQSTYTDDARIVEILQESQHRVRSMALVHELIYQSTDLTGIPALEYVRNLCRNLAESYRVNDKHITLDVQVDELTLDLDTAIPCGLVLNELVSNAFKHAFRDRRSGKIQVELRGEGNRLAALIVRDDGSGIQQHVDPKYTKSLGLQLVMSLGKQLGGSVDFLCEHGTMVHLRIDR